MSDVGRDTGATSTVVTDYLRASGLAIPPVHRHRPVLRDQVGHPRPGAGDHRPGRRRLPVALPQGRHPGPLADRAAAPPRGLLPPLPHRGGEGARVRRRGALRPRQGLLPRPGRGGGRPLPLHGRGEVVAGGGGAPGQPVLLAAHPRPAHERRQADPRGHRGRGRDRRRARVDGRRQAPGEGDDRGGPHAAAAAASSAPSCASSTPRASAPGGWCDLPRPQRHHPGPARGRGRAWLRALHAFGNPSSGHAAGREARALLDEARARVAAAVRVHPRDLVFTSGATESAMLAIRGALAAAPGRADRPRRHRRRAPLRARPGPGALAPRHPGAGGAGGGGRRRRPRGPGGRGRTGDGARLLHAREQRDRRDPAGRRGGRPGPRGRGAPPLRRGAGRRKDPGRPPRAPASISPS